MEGDIRRNYRKLQSPILKNALISRIIKGRPSGGSFIDVKSNNHQAGGEPYE
jgi:hypothetical protein